MLKARVVMYQKDNAKYAEAASGLAEIIASGEFELTSKYADIWVDEGEFNKESILKPITLVKVRTGEISGLLVVPIFRLTFHQVL